MVDVLTELSLVQGARSYNRQMLEQAGLKPREYIWNKFDIDSLQFARSSDYYARNYVQYQRIYDRVKVRLEGLKDTYDSIRAEEERVRDSILAERERVRDSVLTINEADTIEDPFREDPFRKWFLDSLREGGQNGIRQRHLPERLPQDPIRDTL